MTRIRTVAAVPAAILCAMLLLAACGGPSGSGASPSASATASQAASPSVAPSGNGESSAPSPAPSISTEPSAEPSDENLPPFACALPIEASGNVTQTTNLTDVRVAAHESYDRIVFQFSDGIPDLRIESATPPFTQDASGMEIQVAGNAFLRITLRGATKMTDAGGSSYTGSTDFKDPTDRIAELVESGDFEAVNTWIVGMDGAHCLRAFTLPDPARLVIDIEH